MANTKRQRRRLAVIDAETDPFLHGRIPQPFVWGFYDGETFRIFTTTQELVEFIRGHRYLVYAHNGGKFDFHFLSRYFDSFSELKIINNRFVSIPFGGSNLRDSYSIIPTSLDTYKKMKFEYWKLEAKHRTKYWSEIIAYLKSDCINLFNYVKAFIDKYGTELTLASTAMKECLRLLNIKSRHLESSRSFYDTFYPWYFGGRVQNFHKGIIKSPTYIYDINSAYPFAMMHDHPIGTDYIVTSNPSKKDIRATDFYIANGISYGTAPSRDNGLSFPINKIFESHFITGHELLAGIETNTYRLKNLLKRYRFNHVINFSNFVDFYYEQKRNSEKHSTEYIFAKLMLNSLYGKFAANPTNYHDYIIVPAEFIEEAKRVDNYEYGGLLNNDFAIMYKSIPVEKQKWYNIATAASITGYVRAMLWKTISSITKSGKKVFYCDTDSITTNAKLPVSNELGAWKLEQKNDYLVTIAPKLYGARDSSNGKWKIASKGIEITSKELIALVHGDSYTYKRDAPTFSVLNSPSFITRVINGFEIPV